MSILMTIPGLDEHDAALAIETLQWGISLAPEFIAASDDDQQAVCSDVTLTRLVDENSPRLIELLNAHHVLEVITVRSNLQNTLTPTTISYKLKQARLGNYSIQMQSGSDPVETISIRYDELEITASDENAEILSRSLVRP